MIDTKTARNLTLDDLSDWAGQNGIGTFVYETASQPELLFRCAFTLKFASLSVDEFSRVVTFANGNGNRMTLIGVIGATLGEQDNCATLTIKCRKDPALGCKDCYIFKI